MNHTVVSLFTEELSFRRYHFLSSRSVHKKGGGVDAVYQCIKLNLTSRH